LRSHFEARGYGSNNTYFAAKGDVMQTVIKHATNLAAVDGFAFLAAVALAGGIGFASERNPLNV
jgi:hypothetical protein